MLANFFGKSKPVNFVVVLALFLIYFFTAIFNHSSIQDLSLDFLLKQGSFVLLFLVFFFFFHFIISKNNLTRYNSYAFLILVVLFGVFPSTFFDLEQLLLNILLFLFARRLYSLRSSKSIFEKLFDAGFWLGISFIIAPFTIVFWLMIYSAVYLYQKITFRTIFIPILGFITPLLLYFTYCFWMDDLVAFEQLFFWYTTYNFEMYQPIILLFPMIFFGFITLVAFFIKTPKIISISGNYRRNWFLLLTHLLVSIAFIVLLKERKSSELMVVFFPIAIIITGWLESIKKNWIKDFLLTLFIAFPFLLMLF